MAAIVRDALECEFKDVALLAVEAYREYSRALTAENWEIMQANLLNMAEIAKQGQIIVAQQEQKLLGSVVYFSPGSASSLFLTEWASLRMLAVLPYYRDQGIGQQLSWECVRRAKQDEAEVIGLHTSELMVAARRMYERLGFRQDRELSRSLGIRYWRYVLKLTE